MRQYQIDRTIYNANRRAINKAYATVSRSLARLCSRGLLEWKVTGNARRYPVLTDEGRRAIDELAPADLAQLSARINLRHDGKS